MYVPEAFREEDEEILTRVMAENPFATLVSNGPIVPEVTLLPIIYDASRRELVGHFAKANPHWRHFEACGKATAIFHGPHAYVSPKWYVTTPNVPTWAYVTVAASGTVRLLSGEQAVDDLLEMVTRFDPDLGETQPESIDRAMVAHKASGIVAFRLEILELTGKFKVGQNKLDRDRLSAAEHLQKTGNELIANLYRESNPLNP